MPFKFIAPGAVMVGLSDKNRFGRVALIGPMTNLIMGFGFLMSTAICFPTVHICMSARRSTRG